MAWQGLGVEVEETEMAWQGGYALASAMAETTSSIPCFSGRQIFSEHPPLRVALGNFLTSEIYWFISDKRFSGFFNSPEKLIYFTEKEDFWRWRPGIWRKPFKTLAFLASGPMKLINSSRFPRATRPPVRGKNLENAKSWKSRLHCSCRKTARVNLFHGWNKSNRAK